MSLFALSVSEMHHSSLKGLWPGPTGSSLRCVGLSSLIPPLEEVRTREDTKRFCESLLGGRRERGHKCPHIAPLTSMLLVQEPGSQL